MRCMWVMCNLIILVKYAHTQYSPQWNQVPDPRFGFVHNHVIGQKASNSGQVSEIGLGHSSYKTVEQSDMTLQQPQKISHTMLTTPSVFEYHSVNLPSNRANVALGPIKKNNLIQPSPITGPTTNAALLKPAVNVAQTNFIPQSVAQPLSHTNIGQNFGQSSNVFQRPFNMADITMKSSNVHNLTDFPYNYVFVGASHHAQNVDRADNSGLAMFNQQHMHNKIAQYSSQFASNVKPQVNVPISRTQSFIQKPMRFEQQQQNLYGSFGKFPDKSHTTSALNIGSLLPHNLEWPTVNQSSIYPHHQIAHIRGLPTPTTKYTGLSGHLELPKNYPVHLTSLVHREHPVIVTPHYYNSRSKIATRQNNLQSQTLLDDKLIARTNTGHIPNDSFGNNRPSLNWIRTRGAG